VLLDRDLAAGLPAFSIVTPDACHDWQGLPPCTQDPAVTGDAWLHQWVPRILAGPDYTAGRLAVVITWDEGSEMDNHVATLVISPTARAVSGWAPYTHCSTLRTVEEILGLSLLGFAARATSLRAEFGL
jgi:phosphatidylinositol-3-phosphatase